jgi:CDP-diacylglycerol--serine O-phosphatidyltransferase
MADSLPEETISPQAVLREKLYSRRHLLPNAVTVGNMFCGFLAIVYAASGRFEKGAIAIGFAILLDGLDGRVARSLRATSKFGGEFDSFSDLVSFGVAPAILVYHWCYRAAADEFGVLINFLYVLCAACRLVRFNLSENSLSKFCGLPSPGAAGLMAAAVYFSPILPPSLALFNEPRTALDLNGIILLSVMSFIVPALALLMISNVEYWSIKKLKVRTLPSFVRLAVGFGIALTWYNARIGLLLLALTYAFSGPVLNRSQLFRFSDDTK